MSNQIKLLKRARKRIEAGRSWFICSALMSASGGTRDYDAYEKITRTIRKLLCRCNTLEDWLDRKFPGKYNRCDYDMMRKTRIAWIDYMIKEIETNGDFK